MVELADILRAADGEKYAHLPNQRRAIRDICACRTEPLGGNVYFCQRCQCHRYSYHSCQNRHCPKCQNRAASEWLCQQSRHLLPVRHFMVTVTLPESLRHLTYGNQKPLYSILCRTAARAIQKLARDPKFIGGEVGILAVLQTWTRDLRYHPHVHLIVTGGGLSPDGRKWLPPHRDYLMPAKALARIFRAKFRDALKKAGLFDAVTKTVWHQDWVIDIRPVGTGRTALKYLAPYIFRVAISNRRIIRFADGKVTFRYRDSDSRSWQSQTLPAETFIRRFLMHVLPHRFVKVRYYGFWSARNRSHLEYIKELFNLATSQEQSTIGDSTITVHVMRCPKCGSLMTWVQELAPQKRGREPPWDHK